MPIPTTIIAHQPCIFTLPKDEKGVMCQLRPIARGVSPSLILIDAHRVWYGDLVGTVTLCQLTVHQLLKEFLLHESHVQCCSDSVEVLKL